MWPDDRGEREVWLRQQIERASKPTAFDFKVPAPSQFFEKGKLRKIESAEQAQLLERQLRAEFDRRWPQMEAERLELLEKHRLILAEFEENRNADVFNALHAHLRRLGWRTATAEDRKRAQANALARRVEVLRVIKSLEGRPEAPTPDWAVSLQAELRVESGWTVYAPLQTTLTAEEWEAHDVRALRTRLLKLAISGRISEEEFDDLAARLAER
jgi:hypothetical protein